MTALLRRLAAALLTRLGFPVRPLPETGPELAPPAAPLTAAALPLLPLLSLGLPGNWTPQTGSEP